MFKTLTLAIETWLRTIVNEEVAAEVSKIDRDLAAERRCLAPILSVVPRITSAVERLEELSHIKENAALRAHIKELTSGLVEVGDTIKKLHPHRF